MTVGHRHEADTDRRQCGGNENSSGRLMNFIWKSWPWLSVAGLGAALAGVDALANDGGGMASLGAILSHLTTGEVSTLHATLFFAMVWIVSSLRIHRLRALWRVGLGLKAMRGISGRLLAGEPKTRAATGGSVGGAGASGPSQSLPRKRIGRREGAPEPEAVGGRPLLDNFRG
jgi:hypothetical protein